MSMIKTPRAERERFGANLRRERLDRGLTQMELALKLGVWLQTVQRWEGGSSYPTARKLLAIATALDVSIEELREEAAGGNDAGTD